MENKLRKIKLSNGQIYSLYDEGALRLDSNNKLIIDDLTSPTGVSFIDELILNGELSIIEVDEVPVTGVIYNVLVQDPVSGKIMKRDTDNLLKDIGGFSANVQNETLVLKLGK